MARRRREGLIAARKAAGYTQERLAESLHVERCTIMRWETGRNAPQPYLWPKLGRLLRLSRDQLQAALGVAQTGLPSAALPAASARSGALMLRTTIPSPKRPGGPPMHAELLTHYEALTDSYRLIDYQAGAPAVYAETVAHLHRLLAAADQVPSSLYQRFVLSLGDIAQLAAWLAIDSQDYGAARQFCALALSSAEEGEDPSLHSYVLGVMSYIHLHAGRGPDALRLLEAALRTAETARFGVDPAVRSWLHEAMAEAYALAGEPTAGARALADAERLFDRVEAGTVPHWLGFFNSAGHAARLQGRCLMRLGDGRAATVTLETACELLPAHYVRERSGTLIDLATAHLLEAGRTTAPAEPEEAAAIARKAWQLAVLTESNRNQHRLTELMPIFRPYAHLSSVQALQAEVR